MSILDFLIGFVSLCGSWNLSVVKELFHERKVPEPLPTQNRQDSESHDRDPNNHGQHQRKEFWLDTLKSKICGLVFKRTVNITSLARLWDQTKSHGFDPKEFPVETSTRLPISRGSSGREVDADETNEHVEKIEANIQPLWPRKARQERIFMELRAPLVLRDN